MNELVALCYAALRPSDEAWRKFKKRLEQMVEAGEINSDEKAAIVASSFTDRTLSEAEEKADLDESTLDEVIYRVKKKYKEDAEERVKKVKKEAQSEIDDLKKEVRKAKKSRDQQAKDAKRQKETLEGLINLISKGVANLIYYGAGLIVVLGLYAGLPGSVRVGSFSVPYANKVLSGLVLFVVLALTFLNLVIGFNLDMFREACRKKVTAWMQEAVEPDS